MSADRLRVKDRLLASYVAVDRGNFSIQHALTAPALLKRRAISQTAPDVLRSFHFGWHLMINVNVVAWLLAGVMIGWLVVLESHFSMGALFLSFSTAMVSFAILGLIRKQPIR